MSTRTRTARHWPDVPPALPSPPHWTEAALCAEVGDDFWFPEKGGSTREAKQVCRACPVKMACLDYALGNDERFGIWGGLSERERRRLKRATLDDLPAERRCGKGLHDMTAENTTPDGRCRECRRAGDRRRSQVVAA